MLDEFLYSRFTQSGPQDKTRVYGTQARVTPLLRPLRPLWSEKKFITTPNSNQQKRKAL